MECDSCTSADDPTTVVVAIPVDPDGRDVETVAALMLQELVASTYEVDDHAVMGTGIAIRRRAEPVLTTRRLRWLQADNFP